MGKEEHVLNTELNVCNLIREDVSSHCNNGDAIKSLFLSLDTNLKPFFQ